ncbi:cysteine desulfurase family protein [Lacunimicrobium album]
MASIEQIAMEAIHVVPVYLDYNATTPLDPAVFEAMTPWFLSEPGNAGSRTHVYGQRAKDAVEKARETVASHFNATPEELVFTSGATESNNIVLLGLARHGESCGKRHIIASSIEHKAVLEPLEQLRKRGFEVELVPVTQSGFVEPDAIKARLRKDTLLVSVMHANNETGIIQPVEEIAAITSAASVPFHVDVAQTFGKECETLKRLTCDFASVSGHKICGPKGIGALLVRKRTGSKRIVDAITFGGGQEQGLRPGTVPVRLLLASAWLPSWQQHCGAVGLTMPRH